MNPLIQTSLSLLVVLGVIVGFAYVIRRLQLKLPGNQSLIHVKSSIALGSKERLALIEVNGEWILIGITGSSINHILTLQRPPDINLETSTSNPSWLQTYLTIKKNSKDL
jgi:flagellar protein FliO/FliZ